MIDAANNTTTTAYDSVHDLPAVVTDAQGNTACYKYDHRGRKIAEWGTSIQPACFGYDDMGNMTILRTFRAGTEIITTDPSERTDGDVTTWAFHLATGLELSKTYADGTAVVKTYDAYNRLATETDARGNVKTHSYELARGLHLGTSYSDNSISLSFAYNHLGQMTQVIDDAGTRTMGYNSYAERESDSLVIDGDTHLITELRDSFGCSTGYTYAKNGSVIQSVSTGYGTDGRINSAGFLHGGEQKSFGYEYLSGTNLLHKLTKPNNMTLTQSYEATRDLLTGMAYHRGSTLVAQREYSYDVLGCPTARTTSRQGNVVNDTFIHNSRSELASAQVNGETYGYDYDNVGNRRMSMEAGDYAFYEANALNQYTDITGSENEADFSFTPEFDADGNQTSIKTETGIWTTIYNAENRPICFTNEATGTVVTCAYDSMGRRSFKRVTVNGTVTLHQRYIYRNYQQIACIDLTRTAHPCLWLITWAPSQTVATRPLAIQISGTWHTYGWDLTKNICELYGTTGYISRSYTYTPFGQVTTSGSVSQPIQWSSELWDSELGLVYYNWRYYNTFNGGWINRDKTEKLSINLYNALNNKPINIIDNLGLYSILCFAFSSEEESDKGIILGVNHSDPSKTIVVFDVFSGKGPYENQAHSTHVANMGAIPLGEYWMSTNSYINDNYVDAVTEENDYNWYKLYGDDGNGGKKYDQVVVTDPDTGKKIVRAGFNLHAGLSSAGCVTVTSDVPRTDELRYPYAESYENLREFIEGNKNTGLFHNPRNINDTFSGILHVVKQEKECYALLPGFQKPMQQPCRKRRVCSPRQAFKSNKKI